MSWVRLGVLALAFVPFGWFAARDLRYHLGPRKPRNPENLIHLLLGVSQVGLFVSAVQANFPRELAFFAAIAVFGAIDEFAFHRELPAFESDVHAKAHFALFVFVAVALGLNYALPS